jgi:hypothetical protein
MPEKPAVQEPHRGEHHWANPNNDDQMDEINMIFGGSMSITSKTQGKKLKREISLAQRIESRRRMKWFKANISFVPEDDPETEFSNQNCDILAQGLIELIEYSYHQGIPSFSEGQLKRTLRLSVLNVEQFQDR